ncbi:MAG: bifunctional proline dehydrogenase/L-glutamate gamma-semialdehyde dehydrogenase [Actinomycetes bacterium]
MIVEPVATDAQIDATVEVSIRKALDLINQARSLRNHKEKVSRRKFSRLVRDARSIEATMGLTDEVMRINSSRDAIRLFRKVNQKVSIRGFGIKNSCGLHLVSAISRPLPRMALKLINSQVRSQSRNLILPAEPEKLSKVMASRKSQGFNFNVNVLGEAVLGAKEADERESCIIEMISRADVDFVSVKLSSITSQLIAIDHDGSVIRVSEKLRNIYRAANTHNTFINLDMEEYRDLALTVRAFTLVLSEPEFLNVQAGIVLQAYLPESHSAFADLASWAVERNLAGGAAIKIRLVKGANLAMEKAEAHVQGWVAAPYSTKAEVDASYARLIDAALRTEYAGSLRIGIASHNIFHISWAIEVARSRGVSHQIDIEMLEGMAQAEARALAHAGNRVLLYAPVTRADDFASAIAYLVRRLDENTSDENYLTASFTIDKNPSEFERQKLRFEKSVEDRHEISTSSRRHGMENNRDSSFFNQPSGDPTNVHYWSCVSKEIAKIKRLTPANGKQVPVVINGESLVTDEFEYGSDPGDNLQNWYSYSVINRDLIESAISAARVGGPRWNSRPISERRNILLRVAEVMENQRALSIAVMARDTGKTVAEADPEVSEAIDFARYYAHSTIDSRQSSPIGTVLVVPPWNFPYAIPAGGVLASLAAGNSVILKPAPESVAVAWLLVQQLWQAGVPKEALHFLPARDDDSGQYLVKHPGVDALVLTGSLDTARLFTEWRNDLNLLGETSGKNSIIISACADIEAAVKDLVQSAFGHAGQKCSASSIGIILKGAFDNPLFLRQLVDDVTTLHVGAGWDLASHVGPIIRPPEGALLRALSQLDEGESWIVEPEQIDESGNLWRPGVKVGVKPGSWTHTNEWFGPVLGLIVVDDLQSAIEVQNGTAFGLTAGLHSLDEAECEYWMEHVQAGNLYINRGITGAVVGRQPFGGWKASSVGATVKAGGPNYVHGLRNWKPVSGVSGAVWSVNEWWKNAGSKSIETSNLVVERNYFRYRRPLDPVIVRVDHSTRPEEIALVNYISDFLSVAVSWSNEETESISELIGRAKHRVRWLSSEPAPRTELLKIGVSIDIRPVAQRGDIEIVRWLLEQSVSINNHRFGNVKAGPKPICLGLRKTS